MSVRFQALDPAKPMAASGRRPALSQTTRIALFSTVCLPAVDAPTIRKTTVNNHQATLFRRRWDCRVRRSAFVRAFVSIWRDPSTRAPSLRRHLPCEAD
ncbi:hypothetical protein A8H39_36020 [Paraburkholderia fungorum]|nr:hypothetical protein A8H39_36020 [Paraburkholderia fungorum]